MQFNQLKRRQFITLLCGAAAWPLAARAQQHGMPVVGYLSVGEPPRHLLAVFKQALAESGLIEGRDVSIESSNTAEGLKAPACYSLKCSS
jgi:putative ABC transport system substrate-binding protein